MKTLYGLKQSRHQWYQKLTSIFLAMGFKQCAVDQAVFYKVDQHKHKITVIAVHVDNCTIAMSTLRVVKNLKSGLHRHVEVTDLGTLHWMLRIEIWCNCEAHTIHLSQTAYINSILHCYNLHELKPLSTPMDTQVHLTSKQVPETTVEFVAMCNVPYHKAVSTLNWAALTTCPNIVFAVATVACSAANPRPAHWEAVKQIFHYLAGTHDLWLSYGKTRCTLAGYADVDGSMAEDQCAISGYAFLINSGTASWSSKWQEVVSLSTTESKYVAATHGMKEALWLRSLLSEVFSTIPNPTTMFSDNQAAIALARNH